MHLLSKAFTTKLWQPVLVTHLPPHPAYTPSAGGMLRPHQTPRGLLAAWAIKMWIKNLVPPPSAVPGRAIVTCTDTAQVVGAMKARGGAQVASKAARQPAVKSVLLQHQILQPTTGTSSSLGSATRTSMLSSSSSEEIFLTGAECLQMITAAQSRAINSCLACSELVKWAQFILHRDFREQWGKLWQAGGSNCPCQGPFHFSPVRWLSYYISSLMWKLRLFYASGSMSNWRKYMAALIPCTFWWAM